MKHPAHTFDTGAINNAHRTMHFLVVVDESRVESMFSRIEDAMNHALEVVAFSNKPVHIFSINHGDRVLTVWPRNITSGGDDHGE